MTTQKGREGKEYSRAEGREGTDGASPCEARQEGVLEPQGRNPLPGVPVTDEECGQGPNSGGTTDILFALSRKAQGDFVVEAHGMEREKKKRKHPWFIWLSLLGLMWVHGNVSAKTLRSRTKFEDEEFNRHLGYTGRLLGLMLGMVMIPSAVMCYLMGLMPEPWATVWNCFILLYVYLAGVFITDHLYQYCNRERKNK